MDRSSIKADYLERIRNIGIIAHIDAGKTTLTERILYYSQRIHRIGEVHEGTATMDYLPDEQERGITIGSACTTCLWGKHTVNIVDTPGHVDFTIEVDRSLRVLDGAVGVFCAVGGVEPQSETVWKQSAKYHIPKIAVVNKMDRVGADFTRTLESMREKLAIVPLPIQIPVGEGDGFKAVIDVIRNKKIVFDPSTFGADYELLEPGGAEKKWAEKWRAQALEALADFSDELMELYLEGEEIGEDLFLRELRKATLELKCVPVLACSALKNIGVQPVVNAISEFLPSPADVPSITGIDPGTRQEKKVAPRRKNSLVALSFKVTMETGRKINLLRIYSGELEAGQEIYNVTQDKKQRVARLFFVHAERKEKTELAVAGQIVAAAGLKGTSTGDTLCSTDGDSILLERMSRYKPVISLALEPQNSEEEEKLLEALDRLTQEDPTLSVQRDEDTEQLILSGMGELHLEVVLGRIRRDYNVSFRSGNPQVVFQETIESASEAEGKFGRELGGEFHAGMVRLSIQPRPRASGNDIKMLCDNQGWDKKIVDAVFSGIEDGLQSGVRGYPVQDVQVGIEELKNVEEGPSPIGYRMAAITALKQALENCGPLLLEPIMWVEIHTPGEFVGDCVSLLGSKGARMDNMFDREGGEKVVQALVPLQNMFGFSTELRSGTQGRANLIMKFERFDVAS